MSELMAELKVMASDPETVKRLKALKLSRRGKKGSISKRANELEKLVEEKRSRRRMQFLTEKLLQVYEDLKKVCMEIFQLCDEVDDYNDLDDVECRVDSCVASEYLQSHQDDPSSGGSFTSTWVNKHAVGALESVSSEGSSSTGHSAREEVTVVRDPVVKGDMDIVDIPEGDCGIWSPEESNNMASAETHGSGEISGGRVFKLLW